MSTPYEVLRLPRNFTLEQLKLNYKRLALQLHPDKNTLSNEQTGEIFKLLTTSYKTLLQEHHDRESDRPFTDLRRDAQGSAPAAGKPPTLFGDGQGFDSTKFNEFFSENKLMDPANDSGYGDWLKAENPVDRPMLQSSKKTAIPKECKSLMLHVDAIAFGRGKLSYSEMGVNEVDDFSLMTSTNRRVGATDLRVAYSMQDVQDGPEQGSARREYKDIDELERDRASISFTMNDKESRAYDKYKRIVEKHDTSRQSNIRQVDKSTSEHFDRIQKRLAI